MKKLFLTIPHFMLWAVVLLLALPARAANPVITTQPTNVIAPLGSTVSFTVVASGATTYKWHKLSAGSATIGTQATLTLANIADSDADTYTVVVGNGSGSVTSSPATLTVTHPPVITIQPSSVVVNTGDEADFDVDANGTTPFSYQWESNGVPLVGETGSSLSLNPTLDSFAASYSVVITNSDGSSNSANALLSVVEPALVGIPSLAAPVNSCSNVTLSVVTYGTDPTLQYQWYFTTNLIPVGTNGPILSLANISFANAGLYSVIVSNPAGFGSYAVATNTLTVQDPPPTVLTRNITVLLDASGNASITPSQVDNGSYATCGIASESVTPNTFNCLNVGTNSVTLTVTDVSNQMSSAMAVVTIQDMTPPTPVFNTISVQLDATGNYSLTLADSNAITAGSSDACGIAGTNISPNSFTFCDVGAKTVTLTLTDIHGNTVMTNGTVNVLRPVAAPAVVFVDASYSGCGPVTFPNVSGTGSHFIGYDAFATVQAGVNAVLAGGTVNVAAGTYNESVSASKSVTLLGANQGAAGCGSRVAESIINSGGTAITVGAADVVIDGFNLTGVQGVQAVGYAAVIRNNVIGAAAAGINAESISTTATNLVVENNCITLSAQVTGGTPTFGVLLAGVTGTQSPVIQGNGIQGAFYGYMLYGLNASVPTVVQGGAVTGVMQGVAVVNINPVTLSSYSSSIFRLDGLSLSGFTGNWPSLPNNNIHAGVYIYSGGSSASAEVTGTLTNLTITGTDNLSADSAGLDFADFSTGVGVRQQLTVQNCVISTNSNRGIFISGTNAAANISGCSLIGNGFNPYGSGGNPGFGVIARNNSQVTVSQCFIANPVTQTSATVTAIEADANTTPTGPTLTVTGCSIINNGNGSLAGQSAGTLNASGNWWGSTSDTTIASLMTGVVDFTPFLDSGTDTDNVTPGFQGDFSTLHVTTLGAQTTGARVQEGHDLATGASPTVIVQAGSYSESVAISKAGFTLKSAQNAGVDARGARNAESIMSSTAAGGIIQISANNVTVDGMQTAGPGAAYGVNVSSSAANATIINTIMSGGAVGAGIFGTATARYDVASVPANTVGILVSGASSAALLEYNSLTGDGEAGIKAALGATVDAGDCSGNNVTQLGTGSGLNGSSAGGNSLTGYGFDNSAPWAIENLNSGGNPAVLAYQNSYGAVAGNVLASLFSGTVLADQSGSLLLQAPPNVTLQCLYSAPSGATDLAGFMAQGGTASTTAATVYYNDSVVSSTPNNRVITRTYTVADACGFANCVQTITVDDTTPPTVVTKPATITLDNSGNGYITVADVYNAALSSDNCVTVTPVSVSPSAFTYCNVGTVTVLVTAMDSSGNLGSNTATVTVQPPVGAPAIVYVDTNYTSGCAVPFPFNGGNQTCFVGYNAFPTIQAGLNAVALNGTVNIAPGLFTENLTMSKLATLAGAGSGSDPTADTVIVSAAPNNPVITVTAGGGTSVTNPLVISALRVTGAIGADNPGAGIELAAPGAFYLFTDVAAVTNGGDGLAQNLGGGGNSNIVITGCTFSDNGSAGLRVPTSGSIDGLTVTNSHFDGNVYGMEVFMGNGSGSVFQNVNVSQSTFNNNSSKGTYFEKLNNASFSYITVSNSGYTNANAVGFNINLKYGAYSNVVISNSDIIGCGNGDTNVGGGVVIEARGTGNDSSYSGNPATLSGVTLANLNVTGSLDGIRFGEPGKNNVGPTGVVIVDCNLSGNSRNGVNNDTVTTTVATSNWWGNVSGPSGAANPYGTGSGVSSLVSFSPWLGDSTDTEPAVLGFQPNSTPAYYPPVQLVFTTQPAGTNLGSPLSSQPVVQIEDINGNVTQWATPFITNTLGNDLTGAVLLGTTNEPATAGVATFTDLYVAIAGGSNLTLVASAPSLPSVTSSAFNITNPAPAISSVNPFFARAGGSSFTLTVIGSGFVGDSVVYWNGMALTTTYVSPTELTAIVPGSNIASVGPNTVTVGSPGPGGGATAPVNFSVDVASPPIVYVDTNYVGLPANTLVNWPYTGTGTHIIGYDAFPTIQEGVDGVAASGTVNVAAGVYVEDLDITQPLNLVGPNATINPNTGTRVPEAVIEPATSDADPFDNNAELMVYVGADQVSIAGFTVDGSNPNLTTNGVLVGTNYVNASEGIVSYDGRGLISISNNIIRNTAYTAVDFDNYYDNDATATNYIRGNQISNLGAYGYGVGVLIYNNFYVDVCDNVMTNVVVGVQTGNFYKANPGTTQSINNNVIATSGVGVFFNLMYDATSTFVVSNNAISFVYMANAGEWDGMLIGSIESGVSVNLINNTVSGTTTNETTIGYATVGYNVWNTPTTGNIAITGGSVNNANYGVWVNNYDGYSSPGASTHATVSGVNISGAAEAGVYVQDDPLAANGSLVRATVSGNTVISSSALGVWVQGVNAGASVLNNNASITGNGIGVDVDTGVALLQNNDLTGNSVAGISATNGAIVDAGDCYGGNVTGLGTGSGAHGSSAGGNNLNYGFAGGAPWAILNVSGCTILAEQDNFGATMPTNIAVAFNDPSTAIVYSQSPAVIAAPAGVAVTCDGQVPPPVNSLSGFISQGGYVSVGPVSYWQNHLTVTPSDNVYPVVGNGTDIRTYTIVDSCSTYTVAQTNTVLNTNLPVFTSTPPNASQGTDLHSCTATVSITAATATGYCDGPDGQPTVMVTAARSDLDPNVNDPYPIGLTTIIWTARDLYGNQNTYTQTVTVVDTTPPVVGTWPANQNAYVGGTCEAAVPDLSSQVHVTSSCNGVNITQIPPANTMVSVGVTNVIVVVTATDNPNNSVSNVVVLTVIDTNPPTATYVDTGYIGLPAGTVVTWPAVGGNGTHYIGCDAFATIQGGVNRVATSGTVNVAAGSYAEWVTISNPLCLVGPNADINPNLNTRNPEAIIYEPGNDPESDLVVTVANTTNVVIKGFTIDGDNDLSIPGQINASEGVYIENSSGITISNTVVKDFQIAGVDADGEYGVQTNINATQNLVTNVPGQPGVGYGYGILFENNSYGNITTNVTSGTRRGLQVDSNLTGPSNNVCISGNQVDAQQVGIWINNSFQNTGGSVSIQNNVITSSGPSTVLGALNPNYSGIFFSSLWANTGSVTASNNTVSGQFNYGILAWNNALNVTVQGGSINASNMQTGVLEETVNYYGSVYTGGQGLLTLNGLTISNAPIGVWVEDNGNGGSYSVVQAFVQGVAIGGNGGAAGVQVTGPLAKATMDNATVTGNAVGVLVDTGVALLQTNVLTGNSVAGISVTNGAIVDAGNCTGINVTGLGISAGGNNLAYGFAGSPWAIINGNTGGNPIVLADHDNFGAVAGNNIPGAFSGNVEYSQSPAVITAPTDLSLVCASDVPPGVTTLSDFIALGGYYSAGTATVSSGDDTNFLGSGVIHRTYTVTDKCGVASMAVQTITVSDTNAPYFTLVPTNVTYSADLNQCSKANVTWAITAGDNCGVMSLISTPPSGSTFPKGPTTVTTIATDYSGNTATNIFTVTVVDLQPPNIVQCAGHTNINANTNAQAMLPDLTTNVLAADNCSGPIIITQIPAAGTLVGLGNTLVTLWATDTSGNSNFCTTTVTVDDVTPPTLTRPVDLTVTTLQDKDPFATGVATATDANTNGPVVISYADDYSRLTNCDTTGEILRTWTAVNASNLTSIAVQTITVVDTNTPFYTYVPANITTTNDPTLCSAVVTYPAPTAVDPGYFQGFENTNWMSYTNSQGMSLDWNDSASHVSRVTNGTGGISAASGAAYGVIDSTVPQAGPDYVDSGAYCNLGGLSSWDYAFLYTNNVGSPFGNGYRVSVDVYLNLNDPAVVNATPTSGYGWDLSASASDNQANFLSDFIFHTAAYGANGIVVAADYNGSYPRRNDLLTVSNHAVITSSGWYKFEWNFRSDTNNALAVDLSVRDAGSNTLFSQTLGNAIPAANVDGRPNYLWFIFVAADQLPIDNTSFKRNEPVSSTLVSGSAFNVGTTTVTNTTADACGNTTNTTFTVTVNDVEPPSANVPANIVQTNDPGQCGALVSFNLPSQTDNCGVAGQVATPPSGSFFPVGTTTVTVVVTDIHNNTATNTFTVTVNDVEPPTANVPMNIVQTNDLNQCGALVYFTIPTNTDNCGVSNVVATPPSGSLFPVGTTTVTVVVTDIHNNTATNTFTVTVNDTQAPVPICPVDIVQGVDAGQTYATVNFTPNATDNCGVSSVIATPASGTHFNIGTNVVSVVATDIHGNSAECSFTVQVVGLPQITQQPASRTNNAGTTATFTVVATSPTPIAYFWKKNGILLSDIGNISGSATGTLTITNVSDSDVASYSVCVSNLGGKVLSSNAMLTVIDPPVIVSITPVSQTNNASTTATFSVAANGTLPFNYQWTKITANSTNVLMDGGNITGSTNSVLTISNVLAADQAEYLVTVSNPAGSPTTNGTLVVIDPAILVQPVGVTTNLGGNATFAVVAAGTGSLSYQWMQNNIDLPGQTGSTLTITDAQDSDEGTYTVVVSNSVGQITSLGATLALTHPPVIVTQPASRTNNLGTTATFTISVNGATPFTYQWEKNGTNIAGATNRTLILGSVSSADAASYLVAITNSDGYIISAPATLTVIVPPAITVQPVGLTNNAGTTASFSATASGTSPAYQWYKVTASATNALSDTNNISGSLGNVLTISNVLGADGAYYYLVASNQAGTATSSNAILAVIDPIITNEPVSLTVNLGSPATFSVGAYGTAPQYQWYKNGTNIGGANAATYTIAAATDLDQASYTVVVTNIYGAVTSAPPATLIVIDPPVITGEPVSRTNNAGTTATFSVAATGTAPGYQWYFGPAPIIGANSATLTLLNVQDANAGSYSVVLSNAAGVVTSTSASLTVIDAPVITSQPVSRTNNAGTTATFSVAAMGTTPFVYQWYKITATATNALTDTNNISGSTSNVLTIANVLATNDANYAVTITNAAGAAVSSNALLVVIDPVILVQPQGSTNFDGSSVTFSVTAAGTTALTYQWFQGNVALFGDTNSSLTLTDLSDGDAGSYTVVVSNSVGSVTSTPAILLTVAPLITTQPSSVTVVQGGSTSFSVSVDGETPFQYQWLFNGSNIANATNRIFALSNVSTNNGGNYQVIVANPIGVQTSQVATLTVVVPPAITTQPTNLIALAGQTVSFNVTATGMPLFYQWHTSSNLPTATNATLTLNSVTTNNSGTYYVTVTNIGGSVTSSNVTLAVYATAAPELTLVLYTNGNATVTLVGVPTYNYAIQASSNLLQWVTLTTNVSPITFTDTNQTRYQFYRGRYLP